MLCTHQNQHLFQSLYNQMISGLIYCDNLLQQLNLLTLSASIRS